MLKPFSNLSPPSKYVQARIEGIKIPSDLITYMAVIVKNKKKNQRYFTMIKILNILEFMFRNASVLRRPIQGHLSWF